MIHRTTNTSVGQWMLRFLITLFLVLGAIHPALAPLRLVRQLQPMTGQLQASWRDGTTVYETVPVPATPAPVTVVAERPTYATEAYAAASRKARTPDRPSTCLPRSAWGDSRWCPVTGKIEWSPFNDPSLLYYIGTVRQAVGSTASFRAALAAAVDTDIVEMTADIPLTVQSPTDVLYPARGDSGWVLVRTSSYATLPAVSASNYASAANKPSVTAWAGHPRFLKRTNYAVVMSHAANSRGWHHRGIVWDNDRLYSSSANGAAGQTGNIWNWGTSGQGSYVNQPTYLVLDQCASRSYASSAGTAGYELANCFTLNGQYYTIRRCRLDAMVDNSEAKCISGSQGLGTGLVVDNTLCGASMHVIMGGTATGLSNEYNSDIVYRQNYGVRDPANLGPPSATWTPGTKNHYELKDGGRVVYEGNINGGHDQMGQNFDWAFGPKPQTQASAVWTRVADILIRHNRTSNGADPISCFNTTTPTTFPALNGLQRLEWYNNLSYAPYDGTGTGQITINNQQWAITSGTTGSMITSTVKCHKNTTTVRNGTAVLVADTVTGTNTFNGFNMIDNVLEHDNRAKTYLAMFAGNNSGTATRNDGALNNVCGLGNYNVRSNLTNHASKNDAAMWGVTLANMGNKSNVSATMLFADIAALDYTLAEPAYQTMSTVGGRPGVNMTTLNALVSGVSA